MKQRKKEEKKEKETARGSGEEGESKITKCWNNAGR